MVAHTYNLNNQEAEEDDLEFEGSLSYIVRLLLKEKREEAGRQTSLRAVNSNFLLLLYLPDFRLSSAEAGITSHSCGWGW